MEETGLLLALSTWVSRFGYVASLRNWSASKGRTRPNFALFDIPPVKTGEQWAKCLSQNEVQSSLFKAENLDFRHVVPFRDHNTSKATGVENGGISHFLTPVKFRGGWAKCLSEFY